MKPATLRPRKRQLGLSIIELMVVVTLTLVVTMMAVQIGVQWVHGSRVSRTQSALQHAFSATKSAALQNNLAVTGQEASASLCLSDERMAAVVGGDCARTPFWSAPLERQVAIRLGQTGTVSCISLNNAGVPVEADGCEPDLNYSVSAGNVRVDNKLLY